MPKQIKEIVTKIILRNDVLEKWEASSVVLERGEVAIVYDNQSNTARFKIGDGEQQFKDIPYSSTTPEDVQSMVDQKIEMHGGITSICLTQGSEPGTLKVVVDGSEYDDVEVIAKVLAQGISARVTGGAIGTAKAANAGETMEIHITELNADYLRQGQNILILHGGNAAGH